MTKTNRRLTQRMLVLFVLLSIMAGVVSEASAQKRRRTRRAAPKVVYYPVPTNTVIRVRLNERLSSKTARVGDRFSTTVTEPITSRGIEVIPVGSKIWGRVTSVKQAGRRSPGNITVAFDSCEMLSGKRYPINGSLTTLEADNVNADSESTVKGKSNTKRNVVFIGGGAATGAIIGAIAGGGKGAGIGALIGGALGTGARVYEKEKEAEVKSGTEFGVILNRTVSLPAAR